MDTGTTRVTPRSEETKCIYRPGTSRRRTWRAALPASRYGPRPSAWSAWGPLPQTSTGPWGDGGGGCEGEKIRPRAERLERLEAFAADIYRAMGEWGLLGITVPQSDGGAGLGMPAYALQRRIIARTSIDG